MSLEKQQLKNILEAALLASGQALSVDRLMNLFIDIQQPSRDDVRDALKELAEDCEGRGVELKQVSSGYRFQARQDYSEWVSRLWEEKPPRYSRALLETMVLIAYRQPVTRGEIEEVRGVGVSTQIVKTLLEREWVRVVGHRDVPGKPALYATTKEFLDYFNLKSLEELPTLAEIRDLDKINVELELEEPDSDKGSIPEHMLVNEGSDVADEAIDETAGELTSEAESDAADIEESENVDNTIEEITAENVAGAISDDFDGEQKNEIEESVLDENTEGEDVHLVSESPEAKLEEPELEEPELEESENMADMEEKEEALYAEPQASAQIVEESEDNITKKAMSADDSHPATITEEQTETHPVSEPSTFES